MIVGTVAFRNSSAAVSAPGVSGAHCCAGGAFRARWLDDRVERAAAASSPAAPPRSRTRRRRGPTSRSAVCPRDSPACRCTGRPSAWRARASRTTCPTARSATRCVTGGERRFGFAACSSASSRTAVCSFARLFRWRGVLAASPALEAVTRRRRLRRGVASATTAGGAVGARSRSAPPLAAALRARASAAAPAGAAPACEEAAAPGRSRRRPPRRSRASPRPAPRSRAPRARGTDDSRVIGRRWLIEWGGMRRQSGVLLRRIGVPDRVPDLVYKIANVDRSLWGYGMFRAPRCQHVRQTDPETEPLFNESNPPSLRRPHGGWRARGCGACGRASATSLVTISGATSSYPLVSLLAAKYVKLHPDKVRFKIAQGGTHGRPQRRHRRPRHDRRRRAGTRPSADAGLDFYPIAKYAICVVTNKANTLGNLTQSAGHLDLHRQDQDLERGPRRDGDRADRPDQPHRRSPAC